MLVELNPKTLKENPNKYFFVYIKATNPNATLSTLEEENIRIFNEIASLSLESEIFFSIFSPEEQLELSEKLCVDLEKSGPSFLVILNGEQLYRSPPSKHITDLLELRKRYGKKEKDKMFDDSGKIIPSELKELVSKVIKNKLYFKLRRIIEHYWMLYSRINNETLEEMKDAFFSKTLDSIMTGLNMLLKISTSLSIFALAKLPFKIPGYYREISGAKNQFITQVKSANVDLSKPENIRLLAVHHQFYLAFQKKIQSLGYAISGCCEGYIGETRPIHAFILSQLVFSKYQALYEKLTNFFETEQTREQQAQLCEKIQILVAQIEELGGNIADFELNQPEDDLNCTQQLETYKKKLPELLCRFSSSTFFRSEALERQTATNTPRTSTI